jgi:HEAT repeat protein
MHVDVNDIHAINAIVDPMVEIARPLVPYLIETLRDMNYVTRLEAARVLGYVKDRAAVPGLLEALRDAESDVRVRAAWALGAIKDGAAVPGLLEALRDGDKWLGIEAAWALSNINDSTALAGLGEALRDPEPHIRGLAIYALRLSKDTRAVPALLEALQDAEARLRVEAAWALREIRDKTAVPGLLEALRDREEEVRREAAVALGDIKDTRAVQGLVEALRDPAPGIRAVSVWALRKIREPVEQVCTALVQAFTSEEDDEIRRAICEAVGKIRKAVQAKVAADTEALEKSQAALGSTLAKAIPFLQQVGSSDLSKVVRIQAKMELFDPDAEQQADLPVLVDAPAANLPQLSDDDLQKHLVPLWTLHRVWVLCKKEKTKSFQGPEMVKKLKAAYGLDITPQTLGNHVEKANKFFGKHFKINGFQLFDSATKRGFEFLPREDKIDTAWAIIEQWGSKLDQLNPQGRIDKR